MPGPVAALSGQDTVLLEGRVYTGLMDANTFDLTHPSDIANVKTGKNGNSIYAFNETGKTCEVKLRLVRGCSDDKFLNGRLEQYVADPAAFVLMSGTFVKKIGDGAGNITGDTYILSGGIPTRRVDGKMNTEGDTEQDVAIYTLKFTNAPRVFA